MDTNLILFYNGLQVFILPVSAFAFLLLGVVILTLAVEDWGTEVVENFSFFLVQESQVSYLLPEKAHIIPSFFCLQHIYRSPHPSSLICLVRLNSSWTLSSLILPLASSAILLYFSQATWPFFYFLKDAFLLGVFSAAPYPSLEASWYFCSISSLPGWFAPEFGGNNPQNSDSILDPSALQGFIPSDFIQ